MRYLVTGGAGFIGSHLTHALLARGDSVHVLDNLSTGRLQNIQPFIAQPKFSYTIGDIRDPNIVDRLVRECDVVVHLAAAVGVKLIMENPVETIITNVRGTEVVLEHASRHDKLTLVASTSEVYGKIMEHDASVEALREDGDWRLGPTSKRRWAYACSKAMDEFLAMAYFDEKRLPVIVVRYFNTVGARQTGRYGMVIPSFVQRALLNDPIQVFGDGQQTRCFNHVADAVTATLRLLDTPAAQGQVFNVGNTIELSIMELAQRIKDAAQSTSEIVHVPYDEAYGAGYEDMRRRTPDLSKLRAAIGYEPRHTPDDIIRDVIEHYRHGEVAP